MATVNVNSDWVIDGTLTSKALKVTGLGTTLPTATWSEDFSVSLGDFTTSGDAVWTRVTDDGNGDLFSARSGAISDRQYSKLTVTKTTTHYSSYFQYDYKTSTEEGFDYLNVYVDGVIQKQYSGTNAWTTDGIFIFGIGSHTIDFVYYKDNNTVGGTDQVWIDNVGLYNNYNPDVEIDITPVFKDEVHIDNNLLVNDTIYSQNSYFTGRLQGYSATGARTFNVNAASGAIQQFIGTGEVYNSQSASLTQLDFTLYRPDTQSEIFKYGWNNSTYLGGYFQMGQSTARFAIGQVVTGTIEMMTINGTSLFKDEIGVGARVAGDAMVYIENPSATGKYAVMGKTVGINNWSGLYNQVDNRFTFNLRNASGTQTVLLDSNGSSYLNGGDLTIGTIANETTDVDKFLVSNNGLIKYRTGAEVLSDIGAAASSHTHTFASLTSKPTTIAGYGITDAYIKLASTDDRDYKPNTTDTYFSVRAYFTSLEGMTGAVGTDYQDLLIFNTYGDATGGDINAITLDKSDGTMRLWLADQTASTWGTPKIVITDANASTELTQFLRSDVADTANGQITFSAGARLNDNQYLHLGTNTDARLYWLDGSSAVYLTLYTGDFKIYDGTGVADRFTFARTSGNFTATGTVQGTRLISTIATGTAPLTVSSTTKVTNLNTELFNGLYSTSYVQLSAVANAAEIGTSADLNSHISGIFYSSAGTNMPNGINSHIISQFLNTGSGYSQQIGGRNNQLYYRHEENGVWGAWERIVSDANATTVLADDFIRKDIADTKTGGSLTFNDNITTRWGTSDAGNGFDPTLFWNTGTNHYLDLASDNTNFYIRDKGAANAVRFTFERTTGNLTATGVITGNGIAGQYGLFQRTQTQAFGATGTLLQDQQTYDQVRVYNDSTTASDSFASIWFKYSGNSGNATGRMVLTNSLSGDGEFRWMLRDSAHTTYTEQKMILTSDGLLGVNITGNPAYNLDVGGTGRFTDTVQGTRLISTIATGTEPLTVSSTTVVTNLNADTVDGKQLAHIVAQKSSLANNSSMKSTSIESGVFRVNTLTSAATGDGTQVVDAPSGAAAYGTLLNLQNDSDTFFRFYKNYQGSSLWMFSGNNSGSSQSGWYKIITDDNASTTLTQFLRSDVADTANGQITFAAGARLNDNQYLHLGTNTDARLYWLDGSSAVYLTLYTGDFKIYDGTGAADRFTFGRATGDFTATGDITTNVGGYLQASNNYDWTAANSIGVRMGTPLSPAEAGEIDLRRWTGTGTLHDVALITQTQATGGWGLNFLTNNAATNIKATTTRMYISPTGNVGIGTTAPAYQFHIENPSGTSGDLIAFFNNENVTATSDTTVRIETASSTAGDPYNMYWIGGVGGWYSGIDNSDSDRFKISRSLWGSEFVINTSGNVSIGNTNDTYKLDVSGTGRFTSDLTANTNLYLGSSTSNLGITFNSALVTVSTTAVNCQIAAANSGGGYVAGDLLLAPRTSITSTNTRFFDASGTQAMMINPTGNVSIGNTNNTYKLDVSGTGYFSNQLYTASDFYMLTNATYIRMDNAASSSTRVHGINAGDTEYIGSIDQLMVNTYLGNNTTQIVFRLANITAGILAGSGNSYTFDLGSADNAAGTFIANGVGTTEGTTGGALWLRIAADHDSVIDRYQIVASADDLNIGTNTNSTLLQFDNGNDYWVFNKLARFYKNDTTLTPLAHIYQAGGGDAIIGFTQSANNWVVGIDATKSSFDIVKSTAIDTTAYMSISSTGNVSFAAGNITTTGNIKGVDETRKTVEDYAGTSRSITTTDSYKVVRTTSASAVSITVNHGALTNVGEVAEIDQYGSGLVTIVQGTNVLLRVNGSKSLVSSGIYSRIAIQKMVSGVTEEYRVFGELA